MSSDRRRRAAEVPDYEPVTNLLGSNLGDPRNGIVRQRWRLPLAVRHGWIERVLAGEPFVDALRGAWRNTKDAADYTVRQLEIQVASILSNPELRDDLHQGLLVRGRNADAANILLWGAIPLAAKALRPDSTPADLKRAGYALRIIALLTPTKPAQPDQPQRKPSGEPEPTSEHFPRSLNDLE